MGSKQQPNGGGGLGFDITATSNSSMTSVGSLKTMGSMNVLKNIQFGNNAMIHYPHGLAGDLQNHCMGGMMNSDTVATVTGGAATLTCAKMAGGLILRELTANTIDTLPSASDWDTYMSGNTNYGVWFDCYMMFKLDTAYTWTLNPGSGTTYFAGGTRLFGATGTITLTAKNHTCMTVFLTKRPGQNIVVDYYHNSLGYS